MSHSCLISKFRCGFRRGWAKACGQDVGSARHGGVCRGARAHAEWPAAAVREAALPTPRMAPSQAGFVPQCSFQSLIPISSSTELSDTTDTMIHVFWSRQIIQLDKPIELKIYEWNTGGLLTRIGVIKKSISLIFCHLLLLIVVQLQCFI
jgi:hypothetical protein